MDFQALQNLKIKIQQLPLVAAYSLPNLIDRIMAQYLKKIHYKLLSCFNETDIVSFVDKAEEFLALNWLNTKNSCVSYLAIPQSDATQILVELASLIVDHKNALVSGWADKIMPIQVLMPDLEFVSYNKDFPHLIIVKAISSWDESKKKQLEILSDELSQQLTLLKNELSPVDVFINFDVNSLTLDEIINYYDINELKFNYSIHSPSIFEKKIRQIIVLREEEKLNKIETSHYKQEGEWLIPRYDLKELLNKHILSADGKTLIPVESLVLDNKYLPYSSLYCEITPEEYIRLSNHSSLTFAYNEAKEKLARLENDKTNLLGQLNILCQKLHFNSVEGIGSEQLAGSGAYAALLDFSEYFNNIDVFTKCNIPHSLLEEINYLIDLSSDNYKNQNNHIDTCLATRRMKIQTLLSGHKLKLSEISCNEIMKKQLIKDTIINLETLKNILLEAAHTKKYFGSDKLLINIKLIQYLDNIIKVDSKLDFELLISLEVEEIKLLIGDGLLYNWANFFTDIESLALFIFQLPSNKLELLLPLTVLFKANEEKYINPILDFMSLDKLKLLFCFLKSKYTNVSNKYQGWDTTAALKFFIYDEAKFKLLVENLNYNEFPINLEKNVNIWEELCLSPKILQIILDEMGKYPVLIEQLFSSINKTINGTNIWHLASINSISFEILFFVFKKNNINYRSNIFSMLKQKDQYLCTVWHKAASDPEVLDLLFKIYQDIFADNLHELKKQLFLAFSQKNLRGYTIWHLTIEKPESIWQLYSIVKILSDDLEELQRYLLTVFQIRSHLLTTIWHEVVRKPESVSKLLTIYKEIFTNQPEKLYSILVDAIKDKDSANHTPWHKAAAKLGSLKQLIDIYSEYHGNGQELQQTLLPIFQQKNYIGYTVWHEAIYYKDSFLMLLNIFKNCSEEIFLQLLMTLNEKTAYDKNIWDLMEYSNEFKELILNVIEIYKNSPNFLFMFLHQKNSFNKPLINQIYTDKYLEDVVSKLELLKKSTVFFKNSYLETQTVKHNQDCSKFIN